MKLKKILIAFLVFIIILIGAIIAAPFLFKDQIKAAIDEQLAANVNADVIFDIDNFSLSLLPNFPNLTTGIKEIGVIGRDEFAGEVLFAAADFQLEINLKKLIFDDQLSIQGIYLDRPQIFIKVLANGKANYDIAVSSDSTSTDAEGSEDDFTIGIENWQITEGHIIYDDATLVTYLDMTHVNHSGHGQFSLSVFDLFTTSEITMNKLLYDGDSYLEGRHVTMDMDLNMDLDNWKFTFLENKLLINDFAVGFDGWLAMPTDDIDMDIKFSSRNNTFKSFISLIPAIYTDDFKDLTSSGELRFDGFVKGIYNDNSMPAYQVNLVVEDGMFQYPGLPEAVSNVAVNMKVESKDGNVDNTSINISKFHIDFGQEPFDGYLKVDNLITYPIDMGITTRLNLANLNKLLPIEGMIMEGIFTADVQAKGVYDSVNATIPAIKAKMNLSNASITYKDLPVPITAINFNADINNSTGQLNDTKVEVSSFSLAIDNSPIAGSLLLEDFSDYHWQTELSGNLDFNKLFPVINKLYPLPGTNIGGSINAQFKSEGRMSDLEAERYAKLTNAGKLVFNNFTYTDSINLPQGLIIKSGEFGFSPKEIRVAQIKLDVGASDFSFDGTVSNYINYIFNQDETLKGDLTLLSGKIDLNEWMTEDETTASEAPDETYSLVLVPDNIDFTLQAKIGSVLYENIVLENATGRIVVKNGVLYLNQLSTKTLGGTIVFNGNYNTQVPAVPTFDMDLGVGDIGIKEAYSAFNTVKTLAPIAQHVDGKVSTNFNLKGILQQDMMPEMNTINGGGTLNIKEATLRDSKIITELANYSKGATNNELVLKNTSMTLVIKNGRMNVSPFDVKLNNYTANIGGSTGLDGSMDYDIKMDIPAGEMGTKLNATLGNLAGNENSSETIKINLGLAGTYDNPKVVLLGSESKKLAKEIAVNQIIKQAGGDQALADSLKNIDVNALVEEQKKIAAAELKKQQDSLKKAADAEVELAKKKALEEANKQLKGLFAPKKKNN